MEMEDLKIGTCEVVGLHDKIKAAESNIDKTFGDPDKDMYAEYEHKSKRKSS
jgi:hypothetical protein